MTFSQSKLLFECQFWRRHRHIYVYHCNNCLTDNTVSLFTNVYTAANWLWCKIWRSSSAWKTLIFKADFWHFFVEPLGTNPTQFCSTDKLSISILVFLVPKLVHCHYRDKITSHLVNKSELGRVKRICVFEHSVMTNFNCACPAIQRDQGSGFLVEGSSWLTACMSEQRRFWRDCADAQARLNLRCSHRR